MSGPESFNPERSPDLSGRSRREPNMPEGGGGQSDNPAGNNQPGTAGGPERISQLTPAQPAERRILGIRIGGPSRPSEQIPPQEPASIEPAVEPTSPTEAAEGGQGGGSHEGPPPAQTGGGPDNEDSGEGGDGPEGPTSPENGEWEISETDRNFRLFHTRRIARIDAMRSEERDLHLAEYEESIAIMHELAAADKFAGESQAVILAKVQFDQFQEDQIQRVSAREGDQAGDRIRMQLLRLENLETQLSGIELAMNPWRDSRWESPDAQAVRNLLPSDDDRYALFGGKQAYENMKVRKDYLERLISELKVEISVTTGNQFLMDRDIQKQRSENLVRNLEERKRHEESIYTDDLEDVALPDWIYQIERRLYEDHPPKLVGEIVTLDQVTHSFSDLEKQIANLGPHFQVKIKNREGGDMQVEAIDLMEWYFYEARQLGMFDSLEETYRNTYESLRKKILNTNEPMTVSRRGGEAAQAAAESGLQEDVLDRFSDKQMKNDIKLYESARSWNETRSDLREQIDENGDTVFQESFYRGRGISAQEALDIVGKFRGIKGVFITRGYQQLYDVTSALLRTRRAMFDLRQRGLSNIELYKIRQKEEGFEKRLEEIRTGVLTGERRLAGEFNIVAIERAIQRIEEDRSKSKETPYNFYWSTYELKGRNKEEVEESVNAATRDLLENITAYDANEMLGRMKAIVDAIGRMREPANLKEADIAYLQRITTNRVLFALAPFFGALVQMENYVTIMARWADQDGYDRLREIPTMLNGYTAKALELRTSLEYRFRYRLDGFAGHLSDNNLLGGQLTQRFMRENLEEAMIDDLIEYEIAGETPSERKANRGKLKSKITHEDLDSLFVVRRVEYQKLSRELERKRQAGEQINPSEIARLRELRDPKEVLIETKAAYIAELKRLQELGDSVTIADIKKLRNIRKEYNTSRQKYTALRKEIKDAVVFSGQVMDSFGESARIGAPSIRCFPREVIVNGQRKEIKELLSIEDVTLILEWAIMQEAKKIGDHIKNIYGIDLEDNGGLVRWRMRYYLAGGDTNRKNANMEVKVRKMDGTIVRMKASQFIALFNKDIIVNLIEGQSVSSADYGRSANVEADSNKVFRKGFEDTGFTLSEFNKLLDTFKELKTKGSRAIINDKTIDQILEEMKDLKPVLNYYLAVDIYGSDIFTDPLLRKRVARGQEPFVENLINRLKWFGLESVYKHLPEYTPNSKRVALGYVMESSRSFHETIKSLVYYLGTRKHLDQVYDESKYVPIITNPYYNKAKLSVHGIYDDKTEFEASGMYLGFPNIQLGIKRIMYLNNWWLDFNDLKVARGITNMPFFRIQANALSERLGAKDINEVIWNMDKEYFDLPDLQMWAETMKDAVLFRSAGETHITDKGEVVWGFWDKLLSDAENLWSLFNIPAELYSKVTSAEQLHVPEREKAVEAVIAVLKRYVPMINLMEKALEHDRNSVGSGAGEETFHRNALKFLGWLLSVGAAQRKLQGGREAHRDVEAILFFILQKDSYRQNLKEAKATGNIGKLITWDDKSIWDRVWDKIKPQANPGLSMYPPLPAGIEV